MTSEEVFAAVALELAAIQKLNLKNLIHKLETPLVFSHNDLHQNNIILLHSNDEHNNLKNDIQRICQDLSILSIENRIVLINFEYFNYNYRTFDFANHL